VPGRAQLDDHPAGDPLQAGDRRGLLGPALHLLAQFRRPAVVQRDRQPLVFDPYRLGQLGAGPADQLAHQRYPPLGVGVGDRFPAHVPPLQPVQAEEGHVPAVGDVPGQERDRARGDHGHPPGVRGEGVERVQHLGVGCGGVGIVLDRREHPVEVEEEAPGWSTAAEEGDGVLDELRPEHVRSVPKQLSPKPRTGWAVARPPGPPYSAPARPRTAVGMSGSATRGAERGCGVAAAVRALEPEAG
jgi:hypothetical protein